MDSEPIKASTIAEAARMLGVSNRTVYRRLNKGKLTRVKKSDTWIHNVSHSMSIPHNDEIEDALKSMTITDENVIKNDISVISVDNGIKIELAQRDEAIARLSTENQELKELVKQLQDQMYELAKQTVAQALQSLPQQSESIAPRRSAFATFFARKR